MFILHIYMCVCFLCFVFFVLCVVYIYIYEMGSRDRLEHPAFKNSGI